MVLLEQPRGRAHPVGARRRAFATITGLVLLELLALLATRNAWHDVHQPGPASLGEAVVLTVLAATSLLGGWVAASTTVAVLAHLPGRLGDPARRWARRLAPAATRRLAAVLVGAALSSAVAPVGASGAAVHDDAVPQRVPGFTVTHPSRGTTHPSTSTTNPPARGPSDPSTQPVPVPGWTPSRPPQAPAPTAAQLVTRGSTAAAPDVVVRRGDSLWSIVRRHLGPGATDVEVAAGWPRWYATNRDVIGPDPDTLLPGQVLRAPDPTSPSSAGTSPTGTSPTSHAAGARR